MTPAPVFEDSKVFKYDDLYLLTVGTEAGKEILSTCLDIAHMLIKKNISYGNSALDPVRIFSKAGPKEQLYVRIDDKLNRLIKGEEYPGDNDIDDLIGYLILLKVAKEFAISVD
jgi:hypothetical protein